jgi:hypothetical protein
MGVVTMTIKDVVTSVVTDVLPYVQIKSLQIEHYINNRPVLRCRMRIKEGVAYRPNVRDEVIVEDDNGGGAVRIFGGIVFGIKETDVVDYQHTDLDLDCTGFEVFADNVLINAPVGGTTRAILTTIVTNLGAHGITVDPLMPTGSVQPDQAFPFFTCREAMDQLATVSQWNWKFDHYKQVRMDPPGTVGAPFPLLDTNSTINSLEHTRSLANYVNGVWVLFGDTGTKQVTDQWTGNGSNKNFVLNRPPAGPPPSVVENGTTYPVALSGSGGSRWYFNAALRRLEVDGSQAAPGGGHAISSTYTAQYPGATLVQDGPEVTAKGPWTIVVEYPDVEEFDKADSLGLGELQRRIGIVRRLRATTYTPGLEPGMTVNVTASKRALTSANFLIERVTISHETPLRNGSHLFRYEIEALEGNQYQQNWVQYFRKLQDKRAAAGGGGVGGGSSNGPVTTVAYAFWGGSRQFGLLSNNVWLDVIDHLPIKLANPSGTALPVTVRVLQRTANASVTVQVRIVRSDTGGAKTTGGASASTSWDEELLTFTPDVGVYDYHLQVKGSSNAAQVFALGSSL